MVHFTGLEALYSIIRFTNLRLYNLDSLNDPREFEFAGSIFFEDQNLLSHSKENIFSISFCEEKILFKNERKDQFNFWRLYGKEGHGAAIVFKIDNSTLDWVDHHMAPIIYGKSNTKYAKGFSGLHKLLGKLNNPVPKINFDFGKFFCFHKSDLYSYEKEIRLIFDGRSKVTGSSFTTYKFPDNSEYPVIKDDPDRKSSKKSKYIELRLDDCFAMKQPSLPRLKIDRIIIGHAKTNKEFMTIRKDILLLCEKSLGYTPTIKRSNLVSEFWGKPA